MKIDATEIGLRALAYERAKRELTAYEKHAMEKGDFSNEKYEQLRAARGAANVMLQSGLKSFFDRQERATAR